MPDKKYIAAQKCSSFNVFQCVSKTHPDFCSIKKISATKQDQDFDKNVYQKWKSAMLCTSVSVLLSMAKATPRVREWPLEGAEYALNWHRESPLDRDQLKREQKSG